ncbi:hypothetical protein SAMN05216323_10732 [Williamwhitmania taraxaci]|uniref:Uncharacterized protein n=2 Tax=Williamwhitmania taraxaci TaxID=1640674 RepID=A0A1G6RD51_9BACT|nr:hypothetical protein SAMN05216323_10732 [Williamwhitmania taraxaci]
MNKIWFLVMCFILAHMSAFSQEKLLFYKCQPESMEINIILDKEEYFPYEPILLEIHLKNISDVPQQFGSLNFFSLNLRYQVFNNELLMDRYFLWQNSESAGWFLTKGTSTNPSDFKKEQTLINHYVDFKDHSGEFVMEIGFPIQGELRKGVFGVVDYNTKKKDLALFSDNVVAKICLS